METLQVKEKEVRDAYKVANPQQRTMLEGLFGKKTFQGSIIERVNGFEDACRELGKDIDVQRFLNLLGDDYKRAQERIETVAEALREGKPSSECWYYPYFYRNGSGGFSFSDPCGGGTCSGVGARLRVDTAAKAAHLGKIMLDDYRIYIEGK